LVTSLFLFFIFSKTFLSSRLGVRFRVSVWVSFRVSVRVSIRVGVRIDVGVIVCLGLR